MRIAMVLAAYGALSTTAARADEVTFDGEPKGPDSGFGMTLVFGGGISGFTSQAMRDSVDVHVQGAWNTRVTLGTRRVLALEFGSNGTVSSVAALTSSASGLLYGANIETGLRYNLRPSKPWAPYGFAGIGWQRYTIRGINFASSDTGLNDTDHSLVLPMGAGLSYRARTGFVVDLRGTLRIDRHPGLVPMGTDYASMHTWEMTTAIGCEF